MDVLKPMHAGAHSTLDWELTPQKQDFQGFVPTAHRYDYGTQNTPIWKGVVAAIEFMELIGMDKIEQYTQQLADYLIRKLLQRPDLVEVLTPIEAQSRACMVGFRPKKETYKEFAMRLKGIRVRQVPESKLNSIRISTHIYNNEQEIDRLIEQL